MSQLDQLHSIQIPYPPYEAKRSMTCVSVNDFESYEPLDFSEFLSPDIAEEEFKVCAVGVARKILEMRKEVFGEARTVPGMGNIGSFLGKIATKPFGQLSYVDNLTLFEQVIKSPGMTSTSHRQAFIIDSNIHLSGDNSEHRSASNLLTKDTFVESVAVHELIHLAGIPDVAYFIPHKNVRKTVLNMTFSETAFERGNQGSLFEEGIATLGAYMYLWQKYPELVTDNRTELRVSPDGYGVDLPVRHALYTNSYAYAAWIMERLIDFSSEVWDIFQRSRVYGSSSEEIRKSLKEVDKLFSGLFDLLDTTNIKSLNETMHAALVVDTLVSNVIEAKNHD